MNYNELFSYQIKLIIKYLYIHVIKIYDLSDVKSN